MEDAHMRVDQARQIQDWFPSKGLTLACTLCGSNDFNVQGIYVAPQIDATRRLVSEHGVSETTERFPMLPLICTNCGYTMIFDAKVMGLLD
jgi:hypothetical protein